jgi:hypothetical protein
MKPVTQVATNFDSELDHSAANLGTINNKGTIFHELRLDSVSSEAQYW